MDRIKCSNLFFTENCCFAFEPEIKTGVVLRVGEEHKGCQRGLYVAPQCGLDIGGARCVALNPCLLRCFANSSFPCTVYIFFGLAIAT